MKAKTLTTALAFSSLLTVGGTTFAADANDAYHRAFPGDGGGVAYNLPQDNTMGKAAFGTPSSQGTTWSGHDAYQRAFPGDGGPSLSKPDTEIMGKAAYGTSSSSIDGLAAYRNAFRGD